MIKLKKVIPLIVFVVILVGFGIFYYSDESFRALITQDGIKRYVLSFGILGPLIVILICILASISMVIPSFLVVFATTAIYGWEISALITWFGYTVGAGLCFIIARFLGRDFVEGLQGKKSIAKIDKFLGDEGFKSVLVARLLPFIPFNLTSYLAGVTAMSFSSFIFGTAIGQIPGTIVYAGLGEFFTKDIKLAVTGLTIFIALILVISIFKRKF